MGLVSPVGTYGMPYAHSTIVDWSKNRERYHCLLHVGVGDVKQSPPDLFMTTHIAHFIIDSIIRLDLELYMRTLSMNLHSWKSLIAILRKRTHAPDQTEKYGWFTGDFLRMRKTNFASILGSC